MAEDFKGMWIKMERGFGWPQRVGRMGQVRGKKRGGGEIFLASKYLSLFSLSVSY